MFQAGEVDAQKAASSSPLRCRAALAWQCRSFGVRIIRLVGAEACCGGKGFACGGVVSVELREPAGVARITSRVWCLLSMLAACITVR